MSTKPVTFVSGANAGFWRALYQLLRAAERQKWTQLGDWHVFDLGLAPEQRVRLEARFGWVTFHDFDFDAYPPHYQPEQGSYAWKPALIQKMADTTRGPLIWLDSATIPKSSPAEMLDHIHAHGTYFLNGQASLAERCDPDVLDHLGIPQDVRAMRECVATIAGFDTSRPDVCALIAKWAGLAENPELIHPKPAKIARHMHDQALLSALVLPKVMQGDIVLPHEDIDISSGMPIQFMSTRNKVSPDTPVWADPFVRAYYWAYKTLDQWAHRRQHANPDQGSAP